MTGSEVPNSTTTGTPNAAAMCAGPLSLPTKSAAPAISSSLLERSARSAGGSAAKGDEIVSRPANKHRLQSSSAVAPRLRGTAPPARSFRCRRCEGMDHRIGRLRRHGRGEQRGPRNLVTGTPRQNIADARCSAVCTVRSSPRISCARGIRTLYTQYLVMVREAGAEAAPDAVTSADAPRSAVEVERQPRIPARAWPRQLQAAESFDIRIALEHGAETVLHYAPRSRGRAGAV